MAEHDRPLAEVEVCDRVERVDFGATTVRFRGVAKARAWLNAFTGAFPRPSGALTLVISARTRRNSSSGRP
jgi:hypothetical protein